MKAYSGQILIILSVWFGIGFLIGAITTASERDAGHYDDHKFVSDGRSGCIYRSLAVFMSPGYVAGCELFRKRFEYEGFERAPAK